MAANLWKIKSWDQRIYYYEDEKKFEKMLAIRAVDGFFQKRYYEQKGHPLPTWIHDVKGWRIENDEWVEKTPDPDKVAQGIHRREQKLIKAELRRSARQRGW